MSNFVGLPILQFTCYQAVGLQVPRGHWKVHIPQPNFLWLRLTVFKYPAHETKSGLLHAQRGRIQEGWNKPWTVSCASRSMSFDWRRQDQTGCSWRCEYDLCSLVALCKVNWQQWQVLQVPNVAPVLGELAYFLGIVQPMAVKTRPDGDVQLLVLSKDDGNALFDSYPEQVQIYYAHFLDSLKSNMNPLSARHYLCQYLRQFWAWSWWQRAHKGSINDYVY